MPSRCGRTYEAALLNKRAHVFIVGSTSKESDVLRAHYLQISQCYTCLHSLIIKVRCEQSPHINQSGDAGELVHDTTGNSAQITDEKVVDGTSACLIYSFLVFVICAPFSVVSH